MDENKLDKMEELKITNNLKKLLDQNDKEIHERGFVVGVRVKCKSSSFFSLRGFIESVSEDRMQIRWEKEDETVSSALPITAKKLQDKWYVHTDNHGLEELRLWGAR